MGSSANYACDSWKLVPDENEVGKLDLKFHSQVAVACPITKLDGVHFKQYALAHVDYARPWEWLRNRVKG